MRRVLFVKRWRLAAALVVLLLAGNVSARETMDEIVLRQQLKNGFPPSEICTDEVFIRRVFLDAIGTLPTEKEVREFLRSDDARKRNLLVDYVLERGEFADYWALKWCDLLRVKAEFPSNLWPNAVQAYHRWIRDAVYRNMPYDQFVRALLTSSGSNFRDPPANFYRPFRERTPRNIFNNVALLFMGMRLEKAGLSEDELLGMDAFFAKTAYKPTSEWKEEIVFFDPAMEFLHPETKKSVLPKPLGGQPLQLAEFDDPRVAFADWLTAKDNPWFSQAIANRVWYWLMGRGIIHEVDDIRPDNAPWSEELLVHLQRALTDHKYDLKHLFRVILNSKTYQRSSLATPENSMDVDGFSHYRIRRMDAEVLIDAIGQITGMGEEYTSAIPEPFTFISPKQRSIALADGSIGSSFLTMFGRPGRDTSYESDRKNSVSVFQTLHLLNSTHIQNKIMKGWKIKSMLRKRTDFRARIDQLYLTILSRYPTREEKQTLLDYQAENGMKLNDATIDIAWALINSTEFILKH